MSEHFRISGKVEYWHLPYDDDGGVSYCSYCKKTCNKLLVDYHEGFINSTVVFRCPKCEKAITYVRGRFRRDKEKQKCSVCNKSTSKFNCYSYGVEFSKGKSKDFIICSEKCNEVNNNENKHKQTK